jgi:hypothetical protein
VQTVRERLQPLGRALEVSAAQVARPWRRSVGGVRQSEAECRQVVLFLRRVQARGKPDVVQQPPEVVPRVREVRAGRVRPAAWIDPAEDDLEAGR